MRKLTMLILAAGVAAILAACSSSGSSPSAAAASAGGGGGADLTGKTWQLTAITTKVPAHQGVVPAADQAKYNIEFKTDGTFTAKADCNTTSGGYTTTGSGGLTLTPGPTTLVACAPESLSSEYIAALGSAASYAVANGELTITLLDGGTLAYK